VPDKYLAHYVSTQTDKKIIFWPGYCPTHARIAATHIVELKKQYPKAVAIVHPECRPDVIAVADEVLSTGGMVQYAKREDVSQIILGTEIGIIHRLKKHYPGKQFIPASSKAVCPNMKSITLHKILMSLQQMSPQVKVPEDIRLRAKAAVGRMLT
jgi:quinolinate synthase